LPNSAARLAALVFWALLAIGLAVAGDAFPALTGRVVDAAHILSPVTKANLETKLADLERRSTIQLVVATVPSLGGQEIEPYANDLFRFWKLGQADKNNGVLFLIAPKEHRLRIEVGYGLEGTLTDAISKIIIANAAAPRFKTGDFDGGVTRAVDDIITTLTTDSSEWQGKADFRPAGAGPNKGRATRAKDNDAVFPSLIFLFIMMMIWNLTRRGRRSGGAWIVPINSGGWSSGGGGGSSDSGFSGGGGSSGGGGASGSW
jgi:uncharacterized protein